MIKKLLLVLTFLTLAQPAMATCDYSENPLNWYYTAADQSPTTIAWASARGVQVTKSSDTPYQDFVTAFGADCVLAYSTQASLLAYLNTFAASVRLPLASYNAISVSDNVTLTNPTGPISSNDLALWTDISISAASKAVTLPIMNAPNSIPLGGQGYVIRNNGSNAFQIKTSNGTNQITSLAAGRWTVCTSSSFSNNNGTFECNTIFPGVLPEDRGGTAASSLSGALSLYTGDVTFNAGTGATTIGANTVSNAKAAQMAAHTFKGNSTASTANSSDMSLAVARSEIALGNMAVCLAGADLSITTDQAFVVPFPSGFTRFRVQAITASNPSKNLSGSAAAGGIYTAASKGGTAIVANTQVYTSLTNSTANTTGNLVALTVVNAATASYTPAAANTVYLSLTTPDGGTATADICLFLNPLP